MSRRPTLRERVLSKLIIDPSGCLLWAGARTRSGYGHVRGPGGRRSFLYVHRLMYEWFVEPIPEGLHIDHLCRVRNCAAPAHLEAVTCRENLMRGVGPSATLAAATHCIRGHEFTEANTYRSAAGFRECRTCKPIRYRAWRAAKKASAPMSP
jgi:hypothetical protein